MRKLKIGSVVCLLLGIGMGGLCEAQIEPTWDSMAANYEVPQWFVDGKIGIWSHWGPMSAVEELPPGAFYARFMYTEVPDSGELNNAQTKAKWHLDHYGHPSEFGWEKFIPMFKAEKWDPDALVKLFKDNGACFIMPVACHHDNFDMYDSSHPWNSVKMGPKRDVVGQWKAAAVKHGLKFGVSTHLWWSPGYWRGARNIRKRGLWSGNSSIWITAQAVMPVRIAGTSIGMTVAGKSSRSMIQTCSTTIRRILPKRRGRI